ncbi:NAD(P)H-hydrate dehydratase [Thalassorhabdomicrobium marinisediminis]|uniref:NAD(P)H-hydrate dehydratase n=1 Tax=Thalassorhabdomicrobium marinisediminis TaxID=2170577 RepID=UPI0031ECB096
MGQTIKTLDRDDILAAGLGKHSGHKYDYGHALVLSGGAGRSGAARLAARAALRLGAGAVTLGVPPSAQLEVATQVTAVMLQRVADAAALSDVLRDDRLNALCLGPGFGLSDREEALVEAALASGRSCVLDADALTLLARSDALFGKLHDACVLTPHGGEFARLFPDLAQALDRSTCDKTDATRAAAKRAGCTVLLKGPQTVIANATDACAINDSTGARAAPWLATAGAGDVLSGVITGLLARGQPPFDAAGRGAWLHSESARTFGPGLIAEDLPEWLPSVFRTLGL